MTGKGREEDSGMDGDDVIDDPHELSSNSWSELSTCLFLSPSHFAFDDGISRIPIHSNSRGRGWISSGRL